MFMPVVNVHPTQRKRAVPPRAFRRSSVPKKSLFLDGRLAYLILAAMTALVYCRVFQYPFTNYDDTGYVVENLRVQAGLKWSTLVWSFTSLEQANWHPLTWLSHALDWQIYGANAGGHHATSLVLHVANVLLFFLLLKKATSDSPKSFFAAALFGLHPFNVQSVAWVAERKNLLSTFFLLLALGAYGWYAARPERRRYAFVIVAFGCGLASKPMLVTLPLLLLVLDNWPLRRVGGRLEAAKSVQQVGLRRVVLEKLPLVLLSLGSAMITVVAQKARGAVQTNADFPYRARAENAAAAYVRYLVKAFWPSHFAVFYPNPFDPTFVNGPGKMTVVFSVACALLILAVSVVAWRQRFSRPYFTAGWAWFVISLIPVIGVVQVGRQAMADRYAYVPLLGVFVAAVWGVEEVAQRVQITLTVKGAAAAAVLVLLAWLTWREVGHWASSVELWSHAIDVTSNNYLAEAELGNALVMEQRYNEALPHFQRAAELDRHDPDSRVNIGTIYETAGLHREAAAEYEDALRILGELPQGEVEKNTTFATTWSLGNTSVGLGDYKKARLAYRRAREVKPESFHAYTEKLKTAMSTQPTALGYLMLGVALAEENRTEESASALRQAQVLQPNLAIAKIEEEIGSVSR